MYIYTNMYTSSQKNITPFFAPSPAYIPRKGLERHGGQSHPDGSGLQCSWNPVECALAKIHAENLAETDGIW